MPAPVRMTIPPGVMDEPGGAEDSYGGPSEVNTLHILNILHACQYWGSSVFDRLPRAVPPVGWMRAGALEYTEVHDGTDALPVLSLRISEESEVL